MALPTLNPPPSATPIVGAGNVSTTWAKWFHLVQSTLVDVLHPTTPKGKTQAGAVYQGSGVPSNSDGNDGDVYFRTDTPGSANQRLYIRSGGTWTGIL